MKKLVKKTACFAWLKRFSLLPLLLFAIVVPGQNRHTLMQAERIAKEWNAGTNTTTAVTIIDGLLQQEVSEQEILGLDAQGVPILCGTGKEAGAKTNASRGAAAAPSAGTSPSSETSLPAAASPRAAARLEANLRSWEVIPCVIRDDGVERCRLEVNVNGAVAAVRTSLPNNILSESGSIDLQLRDDGQGNDRVAGDFIFTSESLRFNTNYPPPIPFYLNDSNSPPGLSYAGLGNVKVVETNGETNRFAVFPEVGVLDRRIAAVRTVSPAAHLQVSPHLINVRTTNSVIQNLLRHGGVLDTLTRPIYDVIDDDFDFFICFSTDHIEVIPLLSGPNFFAGLNNPVQINYSGTGRTPYDNSETYGSHGRLKSISLLDTCSRGAYSQNATHELIHQWSAFLPMALGLNEDGAHYKFRSSIGSLVGGTLWIDNGDGSFIMNCEESRSAAHHAPPLDKYMMGLVDASGVPLSRAYSDSLPFPGALCGQNFSNIVATVSIATIQAALGGPRTPGPAMAQRVFSIGFIAETRDRLFNPTEMTFYEILANYYTRPIAAEEPDPYLAQNWVPIGRFFGEGTTWSSFIPMVVRPVLHNPQRLGNGQVKILGAGFPGQSYSVRASSDFTNWSVLNTTVADSSSGDIEFIDTGASATPQRFYQLSYP